MIPAHDPAAELLLTLRRRPHEHRGQTTLGVDSEGHPADRDGGSAGHAHEPVSPTNSDELLFDDVIWVRRARQEHDAFVDLMRESGVEVRLFHDLLAETLEDKKAREWILERRLRPQEVTAIFSDAAHRVGERASAAELATILTGGLTERAPRRCPQDVGPAMKPIDFVPSPLPNQLFIVTRVRGCTAASRSTRCPGRHASTRR